MRLTQQNRQKTHLKLIFFNYLELFVSNAKWVYSLWHRVSWALSKNFFQHRSSGSKLLTNLNTHTKKSSFLLLLVYSPLLLFNAEKIGKDMPVPHYIRFKWLCCTQCHSYSYLVDIVECFLIVCFHLDCRFKMSIRVQAIAAFQRNDITLDQSTNKTEIWMKT